MENKRNEKEVKKKSEEKKGWKREEFFKKKRKEEKYKEIGRTVKDCEEGCDQQLC